MTPDQQAEERKRQIKGCDELLTKGVDLDDALLDLPKKVVDQLVRRLEWKINNRDVLSASISSYLVEIVDQVLAAGIKATESGGQRPRRFDKAAWDALELAEEITGLSKIALLRAALVRLAQDGLVEVDLKHCVNLLSKRNPTPAKKPSRAKKRS